MKNETARREIEFLDYYLQNHTNDYSEESHMAMMMAIKALEQTRPKGKWIPDKSRQALQDCSICGALSIAKANYCSNCGADMRGDSERRKKQQVEK